MLCAVLCWSGAALRLKERDDWIDWDPLTRGTRLPLVTELRRFLVLESRRQPNLATRCMGLALRKLPEHFEQKYGYRPILAESFSDPQLHEGTIYKATNWTPLGFSKGLKRHKSEFYTDEQSPKKYWVYPLQKNPQQLLSSSSPLPGIFQKGTSEGVAGARSALFHKHLRSLSDAFYQIPDHRSALSRRYSKIGMFGLIAHGLLVGSPNVKAIWERSTALSQEQRKAIGLKVRNSGGSPSHKNSSSKAANFWKTPPSPPQPHTPKKNELSNLRARWRQPVRHQAKPGNLLYIRREPAQRSARGFSRRAGAWAR